MKKITGAIVLSLMMGLILSAMAQQETESARSTQLKATARQVLEMLVKEDFAGVSAKFDSKLSENLPAAKLQEFWSTVVSDAGPFQKISDTQVKEKKDKVGIFMKCKFEKKELTARVIFNEQNQIIGLSLDDQ